MQIKPDPKTNQGTSMGKRTLFPVRFWPRAAETNTHTERWPKNEAKAEWSQGSKMARYRCLKALCEHLDPAMPEVNPTLNAIVHEPIDFFMFLQAVELGSFPPSLKGSWLRHSLLDTLGSCFSPSSHLWNLNLMWEKAQNFYAPLLEFLSKHSWVVKSITVGQEYCTVCIYLRRHLLFSQQVVNLSFFLGKKKLNMSPPHFPISLRI